MTTPSVDVVVIGGGITGAGIARDAALRGLTVALFEKADFASGTSSKSSKMVHGGLRYLEHGELRLVFESVSERRVQQRGRRPEPRSSHPEIQTGPVGLCRHRVRSHVSSSSSARATASGWVDCGVRRARTAASGVIASRIVSSNSG